jgi:hypothetical protein
MIRHRAPGLALLTIAALGLLASPHAAPAITAPVTTIDLVADWRLGGEDDEETFFGVIADVARGPGQTVLLADAQLTTVTVISAAGEVLATLGRQGEGPGEVTRLGGVLALPDGRIGLVQMMPGKVVLVDREGLPAGEVVPRWPEGGGRLMLGGLQRAGETLVAAGRRMTRGDDGVHVDLWIAPLADDGTLGAPFWAESRTFDPRTGSRDERFLDWAGDGRWAAFADGRVAVAPERDAYAITWHGGGADVTAGLPLRAPRRTEAELVAARERMQVRSGGPGGGRRRPANLPVEVAPTDPLIREMFALPGGELWVLTTPGLRDQPAGVLQTFHVHDSGGNLSRQVRVRCEGQPGRDRLVPLGDDRFVLIRGHADAVAAMRGQELADDREVVTLEIVGLHRAGGNRQGDDP